MLLSLNNFLTEYKSLKLVVITLWIVVDAVEFFWGFWTWSDVFELRFIFELDRFFAIELKFVTQLKFVTELISVTELDTPELDIEFRFRCDCARLLLLYDDFLSLQLILACGTWLFCDFELFGTVDVCSKIGFSFIGELPLDVNGEEACEDGTDDVGEESGDVVVVVVISFSDWLDKIPELLDVSESSAVFILPEFVLGVSELVAELYPSSLPCLFLRCCCCWFSGAVDFCSSPSSSSPSMTSLDELLLLLSPLLSALWLFLFLSTIFFNLYLLLLCFSGGSFISLSESTDFWLNFDTRFLTLLTDSSGGAGGGE
jgi:hypothetical protein